MATTPSAIAAYAKSSAVTASPQEIVRMAYDRIVTACDRGRARPATEPAGWRQLFHDETVRAQSILIELSSVLQVEHRDPEVAEMSSSSRPSTGSPSTSSCGRTSRRTRSISAPARSTIDGLRDAWVTQRARAMTDTATSAWLGRAVQLLGRLGELDEADEHDPDSTACSPTRAAARPRRLRDLDPVALSAAISLLSAARSSRRAPTWRRPSPTDRRRPHRARHHGLRQGALP